MISKLFIVLFSGGLFSLPAAASLLGSNMKGIAIHSCTETKCLRLLSDTTEKSAWGEIWFMKNINVEIVKAGTLEPLQNFPGTAFIDETNYRITVAGKNKAGKRTETVIDLSDLFVKTYTYEK